MVDIACGQAGVPVQSLVLIVLKLEVVSARTHHQQVLMQQIAYIWGQVKKRKPATCNLAMVNFENNIAYITKNRWNLYAKNHYYLLNRYFVVLVGNQVPFLSIVLTL